MESSQLLKLIKSARNYAYDLIESIDYNGYSTNGTEGFTYYYWSDMSNDLNGLNKIIDQLKQSKVFNKINANQTLPVDKYNKEYKKTVSTSEKPVNNAEALYKTLAKDNCKLLHYIWKNKTNQDIKNKTYKDLNTFHKIAYQHRNTDLAILKDPTNNNRKVLCIKKNSNSGKLRRKDCQQAKKFLQSTIDNDLAYLNMFKTLYKNRNIWFKYYDNQELYSQVNGNISGIKFALLSNKEQVKKVHQDQIKQDKIDKKLIQEDNNPDAPLNTKVKSSLSSNPEWIMVATTPHDIMHNGIKYRVLNEVTYQHVV